MSNIPLLEASSSQPGGAQERSLAEQYHRAVNQHRFTSDLETLSALASPHYLVHLSQSGQLADPTFIRYLQHLHTTWRKPEYARFLRYPNALYFLDALQHPEFRGAVGTEAWARDTAARVEGHWEHWLSSNSTLDSTKAKQERPS
ncbi:hypothetical protein IE81DRAFT_321235 [Ceraceosorus guamensis]|uniref:Mediator of RNA polymerase II transcription subunit 31 n=1 Tax=Ceraceosorus guamensis TaxID=1522189 RepID=A0A316W443_9BASI|nr:hypothetical protein IE81DRAFT_321235 [Ceraceosorus guamensis]PWN44610.1 hypothetical protein IE81DRAFT_321235 [Ceraceosorus guamensis]